MSCNPGSNLTRVGSSITLAPQAIVRASPQSIERLPSRLTFTNDTSGDIRISLQRHPDGLGIIIDAPSTLFPTIRES